MENAKREVNSDTEVLDADNISDGEDKGTDEQENLDEEVIPKQDGEPPADKPEEEKPEEKEEQQETTEEEDSDSSPEEDEPALPKPVEGETDREKALRLELTRVKKIIRDKDKAVITQDTEEAPQANEAYNKLKERYTPEELENMEELFDAIGKKKGYVLKSEVYEGTANQVLDTWLESHEEYTAEKDTDDLHWNAFNRILNQDYNLRGKTPKQIASIYSKVDRDVKDELGETTPAPKKRSEGEVNAQRQKIESVSHSGGTKSEKKSSKELPPEVRAQFKGFEDGDLVE